MGIDLGPSGRVLPGLLLDGCDAYRARAAVAFVNRRGERRVSWLVHHLELEVLRSEAGRSGLTMSGVVRRWWTDGLPVLVDPVVLCEDPDSWTAYAHHLPRFSPRSPGTPRGEWVEWPLPDGVLDLEAGAAGG